MGDTQKIIQRLLDERKTNDESLKVSAAKMLENKMAVIEASKKMLITQVISPNVSEEKKAEVMAKQIEVIHQVTYINGEIVKLSSNDPKSEITRTHLNRNAVDIWTECTRKTEDILGPMVDQLGQGYKDLVKQRNDMDEQGKAIVNDHLQLVNKGIEIDNKLESNQGSLIDDYADPNQDQPGYMDPED